jgi:hypothetical protein
MNYKKSLYAKHLIEYQHTLYLIEKCPTILHHQRKSRKLNNLEQFHIYKATKPGNKLNDQYTDRYNTIFKTVLKTSTPPPPPLLNRQHSMHNVTIFQYITPPSTPETTRTKHTYTTELPTANVFCKYLYLPLQFLLQSSIIITSQ